MNPAREHVNSRPASRDSAELAGILVHQSRRARLTQVTLSAAWDRPKSYTTERWHGKTSLTVDELLIWAHLLDVSVEQVIAAARKRVSHHS